MAVPEQEDQLAIRATETGAGLEMRPPSRLRDCHPRRSSDPLDGMALWILSRPRSKPEATERQVAEVLARLPDNWVVRWGFLYSRQSEAAGEHEGDFLVCGPSGHILVLEVKGPRVRNFVLTGQWEKETDGESPWVQVNEEWQWARARAESVRGARPTPYFHRALALPFTHFVDGDRFREELPRDAVIGADELQRFTEWWGGVVARVPLFGTPADTRAVFLDAFGEGIRPKSIRAFIHETERVFAEATAVGTRLLSQLDGNRQLMVQGGVGSGKTNLALQQARRFSRRGLRTLLLCYNLALAEHLREEAGRQAGGAGIEVLSWEELTGRLLARAGFAHEPPDDLASRTEYYTVTVPAYVLDILAGETAVATYDALVVDEAQDHDTLFSPAVKRPDLPGWWHIYFALLKEGAGSPAALFYDPEQRPRFRAPGGFEPERLRACFSDCAHVRLPWVYRYTRPVFEFLRSLGATGAAGLVAQLGEPDQPLPEGPDVEIEVNCRDTAVAVAAIARRWERLGFCRLRDIVVLGPRREMGKSGVGGQERVETLPVSEYVAKMEANGIRYLSINRAKGLDFLGVIVIDLPDPLASPKEEAMHELLFMGASRARQLLAIVCAEKPLGG